MECGSLLPLLTSKLASTPPTAHAPRAASKLAATQSGSKLPHSKSGRPLVHLAKEPTTLRPPLAGGFVNPCTCQLQELRVEKYMSGTFPPERFHLFAAVPIESTAARFSMRPAERPKKQAWRPALRLRYGCARASGPGTTACDAPKPVGGMVSAVASRATSRITTSKTVAAVAMIGILKRRAAQTFFTHAGMNRQARRAFAMGAGRASTMWARRGKKLSSSSAICQSRA